jgi:hypothetical protein
LDRARVVVAARVVVVVVAAAAPWIVISLSPSAYRSGRSLLTK